MKRILHLLNSLDLGGAEMLVVNLAGQIDRSRFQLMVASLTGPGPLGVELDRLGVETLALHRQRGRDWRLPLKIARTVLRERIDVLHSHNSAPWLYAAAAAVMTRRPLVHTQHSVADQSRTLLLRAERAAALATRRVIADAEDVRHVMVDRQGMPADKVVTIVNGIDTTVYGAASDIAGMRRALGLDAGDLIIGTVGRMVWEKDQRSLIASFARLAPAVPHARLCLVGDGPLRADLQAAAVATGFGERIVFLGSRADVARILPTFDVFVLSSVSEGLPLALLEAMATGLPVVVTQVGGMGEAVRAGDSGLVVAPGDPDRLTAAVKTLIDDPALRARLGRAAQQRAREHFDLRAMVTAYEDVYQAVAR